MAGQFMETVRDSAEYQYTQHIKDLKRSANYLNMTVQSKNKNIFWKIRLNTNSAALVMDELNALEAEVPIVATATYVDIGPGTLHEVFMTIIQVVDIMVHAQVAADVESDPWENETIPVL